MNYDIVEQLRHRAEWDIIASSSFDTQMCIDAADEIERLRRLVAEWQFAAGDVLLNLEQLAAEPTSPVVTL